MRTSRRTFTGAVTALLLVTGCENGVLPYAYDIRAADSRLVDVEVDARTGRVRRVEADDDDDRG